jgi:hypothetical protein
MHVDSLNLRRTIPNCLHLTPAIALSVLPKVFGYIMYVSLYAFCLLKSLPIHNPSYLSPTVHWMHVDSLNLSRTIPNCPQLTPAIALSVLPTMFCCIMYVSLHAFWKSSSIFHSQERGSKRLKCHVVKRVSKCKYWNNYDVRVGGLPKKILGFRAFALLPWVGGTIRR